MLAKGEASNRVVCRPGIPASSQVVLEAARALVSVLGGLGQQLEQDARHVGTRRVEPLDRRGQQVFGIDLTVAIRADDQEMVDVGPGKEPVQDVERGGIDPLEIIQEDDRPGAVQDAPQGEENQIF